MEVPRVAHEVLIAHATEVFGEDAAADLDRAFTNQIVVAGMARRLVERVPEAGASAAELIAHLTAELEALTIVVGVSCEHPEQLGSRGLVRSAIEGTYTLTLRHYAVVKGLLADAGAPPAAAWTAEDLHELDELTLDWLSAA